MDASKLTPAQRMKLMSAAAQRRDWCTRMLEWMDRQEWDLYTAEYQTLIAARHTLQGYINVIGISERIQPRPYEKQVYEPPKFREKLPPLVPEAE